MEWIQDILDIMSTPTYWMSLLFFGSLLVFITSLLYHSIVSSEIKKRGIEYGQIAVNKISRLSTALMILSIVTVVVAIIVLSIG